MEDTWCNTFTVLKAIISYVESKNIQTTQQLYQLWEQNVTDLWGLFRYVFHASISFFLTRKTRDLMEEIKSEEDMVYSA